MRTTTLSSSGLTIPSLFIDSSHLQATIPYQFTGATGSLPLTVVSPYTGSSNTFPLPLVNPVATIHFILPGTLATGSSNTTLFLYGVNFVSGSVVQWNGQSLATTPNGGETSDGDELLTFVVPTNLLANTGTATIRVLNPGPGGGLSVPTSFQVAPPHPSVTYPASIDFGTILLGTTVSQTILLRNNGSGNYTASSVTIGSPYSVLSNTCANVTFVFPGNFCTIQLQFSPVAGGSANTTLTITDNGTGSPLHIPVTGSGSQMIVPVVTVLSVDSLGQTNSVTVAGAATVGGPGVPGTAWLEYGSDPALNTYTKSPSWSFTGDNVPLSGSVSVLTPATSYAIRLVVQTAGGTGKSNIRLFTTLPAAPFVSIEPAPQGSGAVTVTAGQTATFSLQASDGGNGYTGTASFFCGGVPLGATCTVSPSSVSISTIPSPFKVMVTTTGASSASLQTRRRPLAWAFAFSILIAALLPSKMRWNATLLICSIVLAATFSGCGGGSAATPPPPTFRTPAGSYGLTITWTTGSAQGSFVVILTVN